MPFKTGYVRESNPKRFSAAMPQPLRLQLLLAAIIIISPPLSAVNITHLPGFDGSLPFQLETGYVRVEDAELFYYFIQSERSPREDPLILFIAGGPGCTGLSPLLDMIGPLKLVISEYDGSIPSLEYNPYAWTKVANIIFFDAPPGAGFSFSDNANAYEADDTTITLQIYNFLIKWYVSHAYFHSNPLYIAGDSYGGKIVPFVAHAIMTGELSPLFSNLKGYIVGTPRLDETYDDKFRPEFSHSMGIISDELYKAIEENCEGESYDNVDPNNLLCSDALNEFGQSISDINYGHILERKCIQLPKPDVMIENRRSLRMGSYEDFLLSPESPDIRCKQDYAHYLSTYWAKNKMSRKALHVKKGTAGEWLRCNMTIANIAYTKSISSALPYHHNLTKRGYRALVYSGDHDLLIPFMGTHRWVTSLNFSIIDDWRSWHLNGQVAGYTRKFANDLTYVLIKNAGHNAPMYQPDSCFTMFVRWISQERI